MTTFFFSILSKKVAKGFEEPEYKIALLSFVCGIFGFLISLGNSSLC